MEDFCSPTTRYEDLYFERNPDREPLVEYSEVTLTANWSEVKKRCSDKDFSKDFLAYLSLHRLWVSQHCFVTVEEAYAATGFDIDYQYAFAVKDVFSSWLEAKDLKVYAASAEHAVGVFDELFQVLAVSDASQVCFSCHDESNLIPTPGRVTPSFVLFPVPGPVLSRYLASNSKLETLRLQDMTLNAELCRALYTSRTAISIELIRSKFTDDGLEALMEALHRNRAPITALINCKLDTETLATGCAGNTTLKTLKPIGELAHDHLSHTDFTRLAASWPEQLLTLDLAGQPVGQESWLLVLQSLHQHETLQELDLHLTPAERRMSPVQKRDRMLAVVDLLRHNTVLYRIHMLPHECDAAILKNEIQPRLLLNRYRPRVRALRGTFDEDNDDGDIATATMMAATTTSTPNATDVYRGKLLAQALYKVRANPNLVWLLVSENKDIWSLVVSSQR